MPWIFQYFWFVGAAFMAINVLIWRRRLAVAVERGNATRAEMDKFIRWVAACLIGGPLLLGVIGLVAGWNSPLCAGMLTFGDVPRALVSFITLSGWFVLLWWIWRGSGGDFLSRVGPALGQRAAHDERYSPALVRGVVTTLVIVSAVGAVISSRTMPLPPEMGCRAALPVR